MITPLAFSANPSKLTAPLCIFSMVTEALANLLVVIIPSGILSPDIIKSVFGNIAISQYAFFSIPISFPCSSKTILGLFSCVEK